MDRMLVPNGVRYREVPLYPLCIPPDVPISRTHNYTRDGISLKVQNALHVNIKTATANISSGYHLTTLVTGVFHL